MRPVIGKVYTLRQIINDLVLLDSPGLCFQLAVPNDQKVVGQHVIQNAHVLPDDLLNVPGFADTKWQYELTTSEWIPIFQYVDAASITNFVDLEPEIDFDFSEKSVWWATPKGYPRKQYYKELQKQRDKVSARMEIKINGAVICVIDQEITDQVKAVNWQQLCEDYIKQCSFERVKELAAAVAAEQGDMN